MLVFNDKFCISENIFSEKGQNIDMDEFEY